LSAADAAQRCRISRGEMDAVARAGPPSPPCLPPYGQGTGAGERGSQTGSTPQTASRGAGMNHVISLLARLALRIARPAGREWAAALNRELDEVSGSGEALRWVLGAFATSLSQRIRAMQPVSMLLRVGLTGFLMLYSLVSLIPATMILAYRLGWIP